MAYRTAVCLRLDRIVMLLLGAESIQAIAFPKVQNSSA